MAMTKGEKREMEWLKEQWLSSNKEFQQLKDWLFDNHPEIYVSWSQDKLFNAIFGNKD